MKDKNKENRLKAALRENLKRRKIQTRNRLQTPVPDSPDGGNDTGSESNTLFPTKECDKTNT